MRRSAAIATSAIATAIPGAVLGYVFVARPWHLAWGSTAEERGASLPGAELVADPSIVATRAVTVAAPPSAVWPWLVQMGYHRAGWYSYDRLDNDGVVVRRIVPELQRIAVGDMMLTDARAGFRVEAFEPERSLVLMLRGGERGPAAEISSVFALSPLEGQRTRLIVRLRAAFHGMGARLWGLLLFDAGDFLMMRRQLLGIRERAEAAWRPEAANEVPAAAWRPEDVEPAGPAASPPVGATSSPVPTASSRTI